MDLSDSEGTRRFHCMIICVRVPRAEILVWPGNRTDTRMECLSNRMTRWKN